MKPIECWMRRNVAAYVDGCGEVNATKLAEDAACECNAHVGDDYEIPEEVFDLAVIVAEDAEKRALVIEGACGAKRKLVFPRR